MRRLPRVTGKDVLRALLRAGFEPAGVQGSHHHLTREGAPALDCIPMHARQTTPPKTLRAILNQAGLTVDDLIGLL